DSSVTELQTCALPISGWFLSAQVVRTASDDERCATAYDLGGEEPPGEDDRGARCERERAPDEQDGQQGPGDEDGRFDATLQPRRSEERRVGEQGSGLG